MPDTPHSSENHEIRSLDEPWVFISAGPAGERFHSVIWIADQEPNSHLLNCAERLSNSPGVIPGVRLTWVLNPHPGFVLRTNPGWSLEDIKTVNLVFDTLRWELKRMEQQ